MSTTARKRVYRWSKNAQFWLLPGTCIHCRRDSGRQRDLCLACESSLPRLQQPCRRCGLSLPPGYRDGEICGTCLVLPPPFTRLLAPYIYVPPTAGLIAAFKYQGKLVNGRILSQTLADYVQHSYPGSDCPELLVPTPLHGERLRQRGFNQAVEISRCLSRELHIPMAPRLLARQRKTLQQTGLSARERQHNLRRAFTVNRKAGFVPGMTVAVIDDVVTTGATAAELARTLLRAGAGEVHVWALARTPL